MTSNWLIYVHENLVDFLKNKKTRETKFQMIKIYTTFLVNIYKTGGP